MIVFFIVSLINVFLHIFRTLLVVKANKIIASTANCICYTFSAVVVKFIADSSFITAITIAAITNFIGCYLAMLVFERIKK